MLFGEQFGSASAYMNGKLEEQFFIFEAGFEVQAHFRLASSH